MLLWLALATFPPVLLAQPARPAGGSAEEQIAALEQQWAAAVQASDEGAVAPLVADGYINMNTGGVLRDKAAPLDNIRKSKWTLSQLSRIQVRSYGETAIATGAWRGKGTSPDGEAVETREQWMDTWIRMPDGRWQCIATASAPAK
jgi:ketosteroid isomerase-like protein